MASPSDNIFVSDLPADITEETISELFSQCSLVSMKLLPPKFEGGTTAAMIRLGSVDEATWIVENLNGNIPEGLDSPVKVKFANPPGSKGDKGGSKGGKGFGKTSFAGGSRSEPYPAGKSLGGKSLKGNAFGGKGDGGKGKAQSGGKPGQVLSSIAQALDEAQQLPGGKGNQAPENCLYVKGLPPATTDIDLYKIFGPFGAIPTRGVQAMRSKEDPTVCSGIGFVDYVESYAAEAAMAAINGMTLPEGNVISINSKKDHDGAKSTGKDAGKGKTKTKGKSTGKGFKGK